MEQKEESIKETNEEQLVSRGGEPPESSKTETKVLEENKSAASIKEKSVKAETSPMGMVESAQTPEAELSC